MHSVSPHIRRDFDDHHRVLCAKGHELNNIVNEHLSIKQIKIASGRAARALLCRVIPGCGRARRGGGRARGRTRTLLSVSARAAARAAMGNHHSASHHTLKPRKNVHWKSAGTGQAFLERALLSPLSYPPASDLLS